MKKLGYLLLGFLSAIPVGAIALQGVDISATNTGLSGVLAAANGGTGITTGALFIAGPASNVNFGAAGDTVLNVPLPAGFTRLCFAQLQISGASGSLTTATFGVFTAAGGGGTAVIAAGTAITINTSSDNTVNNAQNINSANSVTGSYLPTSNQLFFRVGATAAQTANVQMTYKPCP